MLADDGYPDAGASPLEAPPLTQPPVPTSRHWAIAVAAGAMVMAVGLVVSAFARSPLTWDGAWFFVRTADTGLPTFLVRRAVHAVLQAPAMLVTRVSGDVDVASMAFSVPYVVVPLLAWLAAWWVVRRDRPAAMLWPTLGICLVTLPGQVFFLTEAVMVTHLAWALVLAAALGTIGRHRPLVVVLVALMAICHPFAAPVLMAIGVVSLVRQRRRAAVDGPVVGIALIAAGLVLGLVTVVLRSPYEIEASAATELLAKARAAIVDPSIVAPLAAWAIGGLALVRMPARSRVVTITVILTTTTIVLLPWALDPVAWASALRFRAWPVLLSLPIATLAVVDILAVARPAVWPDRRLVLVSAPIVMSIVLSVQALTWISLRDRLAATLAASPVPCVEGAPLHWIAGTALDHWSLTSLAVADQGHEPRHVAVVDRACTDLVTPNRAALVIKETPFDRDERPVDGWWGFGRFAGAWPELAPP